jgi:hypothetical protein
MEKLNWRKSTRSSNGGATCVELARTPRSIAVRDSKHPDGPQLRFRAGEWHTFVAGVKVGRFDLGA